MNKKFLIFVFFCCLSIVGAYATHNKDLPVVVFDFGGVIAKADTAQMKSFLMDSFHITKEELSAALKKMQEEVSKGGSEKEYWEQYALSKKIALPKDWYEQFGMVIKNSIIEIPGTINLVKALQNEGYQTAMLSDITQYQAEIVRSMGYYNLFDPILLSYETGLNKPNPAAYQMLLQRLQRPASSVIFIDDRIENVEGAKKEGIDAIRFIDAKQLEEELEKRGIQVGKEESLIPA